MAENAVYEPMAEAGLVSMNRGQLGDVIRRLEICILENEKESYRRNASWYDMNQQAYQQMVGVQERLVRERQFAHRMLIQSDATIMLQKSTMSDLETTQRMLKGKIEYYRTLSQLRACEINDMKQTKL